MVHPDFVQYLWNGKPNVVNSYYVISIHIVTTIMKEKLLFYYHNYIGFVSTSLANSSEIFDQLNY